MAYPKYSIDVTLKERSSMIFLEKCQIDIEGGNMVSYDKNGIREQIPIGSTSCLILEPGTRISHAAIKLAAETETLVIWAGESGVRLYSAGNTKTARTDKLIYQAYCYLNPNKRLEIVKKMYNLRFKEKTPEKRTIEQLRGMEGVRVKTIYQEMAKKFNIVWNGRNYDPLDISKSDVVNQCLTIGNTCLYGITEAAILASGYSPALGFVHSGTPLSFVYDISDIIKFDTITPIAFELAAESVNNSIDHRKEMRIRCRDTFRYQYVIKSLFDITNDIFQHEENTSNLIIPF